MSCGCKAKDKENEAKGIKDKEIGKKFLENFIQYSVKIVGFLIVIALLPIINVIILVFTFNTVVLNKAIDVKPLVARLAEFMKPKKNEEEDDNDDEFETLTEDDVVLLDVEDISQK